MKIGDLIEQLSMLDPETFIHLQMKDTIYSFNIERQYPDSNVNYNMIIKVPEFLIPKNVEPGLMGDSEEDWFKTQGVEVTTASTTGEPIVIDMNDVELPDKILQPFSQVITEEYKED